MAARKKRVVRRRGKSGGHPFLVLLFFVCLVMGSAYMTDRMTNAPEANPTVAQNETVIRHLFNDKERQGLVPKDDPGTPESVKEKVKAALNRAITVKGTAEEEKPEVSAENRDTAAVSAMTQKEESRPQEETKDTAVFHLEAVIDKVTGKDTVKAERREVQVASAASAGKAETKEMPANPKPAEQAAMPTAPVKKESPVPAKSSDKKASEKAVPAKVAPISPAKQIGTAGVTGRLAVVIDDAGRDLDSQRIYEAMGIPLTLAVMPNQIHTREAAASWAAHGLPVIIHQPMESVSGIGMEQKVILTSMGEDALRQMLKESFSQVPEAVGMNNHQGSKATTDRRTMDLVMSELHHRNMFFFDSHTNSTTEADKAAAAYGVRYVKNDLFVDNSADENDICAMIQEGANRAKKNGTYIIIGHCRPHTAAAFRTMVPKLQAQGIQFVYVSSLLR